MCRSCSGAILGLLVAIRFELHVNRNLRRHFRFKLDWCPVLLPELYVSLLLHYPVSVEFYRFLAHVLCPPQVLEIKTLLRTDRARSLGSTNARGAAITSRARD